MFLSVNSQVTHVILTYFYSDRYKFFIYSLYKHISFINDEKVVGVRRYVALTDTDVSLTVHR